MDKVFEFAAANGQEEIKEEIVKIGRELIAEETRLMKTGTIRQIYQNINSPRKIDAIYAGFLKMGKVGKDENYTGADVLNDWQERNLKIFANITRITESKDDRIILIIGAAHIKPLRQLLESSNDYIVEDAVSYL